MNRRNAFTLVELLVVIAIIGVLVSITVPTISRSLDRARRMQCASNLRQLSTAVLMFCKDNRGTFPVLQTENYNGSNTKEQWTSLISSYITKGYSGSPTDAAKDRPVFFCPTALQHHPGTYETSHGSYAINEGLMTGNRSSGWGPKKLQSFTRTSRVAMLADGHWIPSDGWWGAGVNFDDSPPFLPDDFPDDEEDPEDRKVIVHKKGANIVYLDGHTEWLEYSNYSTNSVLWEGKEL